MEENSELSRSKDILNKEIERIEYLRRLVSNPDFILFRGEFIEDKIKFLMSQLDDLDIAKQTNEAIEIYSQVKALRGMMNLLDSTINRKSAIEDKLKELNDAN